MGPKDGLGIGLCYDKGPSWNAPKQLQQPKQSHGLSTISTILLTVSSVFTGLSPDLFPGSGQISPRWLLNWPNLILARRDAFFIPPQSSYKETMWQILKWFCSAQRVPSFQHNLIVTALKDQHGGLGQHWWGTAGFPSHLQLSSQDKLQGHGFV